MTRLQTFAKEFEKESLTTRKMLQRVPVDRFDWKPHPKSMSLRNLVQHIAELPGWIGMILNTDELDFETNPYQPPVVESSSDLLACFEKNIAECKTQLAQGNEDSLDKPWTLRSGATIFTVEPKNDFIRTTLSQVIHHRAQLGVYLRLLDIPIPGSYGPSADEPNF